MHFKDRIQGLRRVKASDLVPNDKNWRTHNRDQSDALKGVLEEVGIADALLAYEREGRLVLIDGHLRAKTLGDQEVAVLVLDVTEEEADKLLLSIDPLSAMAGADRGKLDALLGEVKAQSDGLSLLLSTLTAPPPPAKASVSLEERLKEVGEPLYRVIVECQSQQEMNVLAGRLVSEGYNAKGVTL